MSQRILILIDGSNMYHILKKGFKNKSIKEFNFKKFTNLISKSENTEIKYYSAPLDWKKNKIEYDKQQKFFSKLRKIPNFELVLCRMQKVWINGKIIYQVKEDDIHIAVDMVKGAHKNFYDRVLLVSSDSDFAPAIKAAQEEGKIVENIAFFNMFSRHLKRICDIFTQLKEEDIERCFD